MQALQQANTHTHTQKMRDSRKRSTPPRHVVCMNSDDSDDQTHMARGGRLVQQKGGDLPPRLCGGPRCSFLNNHDGACEHETNLGRSRHHAKPVTQTIVHANNKFQHGIGFARMCMEEQIGAVLRLPEDLRSTGTGTFDARVLCSVCEKESVVCVVDDRGEFLTLTATDLVRDDVIANWQHPLSETMLAKHNSAFTGKDHDGAARRADLFVKTLRDNIVTMSDQNIFTLDGIGANREAFARGFADLPEDQIPEVKTFEIDPAVALSQQLVYGKTKVIYTGALTREQFGYGCDGALPNSPPGIEYLITTRKNTRGVINTLVTNEDCHAVVALNLDFCGGILGGLDFDDTKRVLLNLLARLPRLAVLCLTFSKRQRPGLKIDFSKYGPTPYGFDIVHTFDGPADNKGVVSRIYQRISSLPRFLEIPGSMWHWNMAKDKTAGPRLDSWRCVIKSIEPTTCAYIMYCIDDDADNQVLANVDTGSVLAWEIPEECEKRALAPEHDKIRLNERMKQIVAAVHADLYAQGILIEERIRRRGSPSSEASLHCTNGRS